MSHKRLGDYIEQTDLRNTNLSVSLLLGVSIEKKFIPSIANTVGTDFSKYKIVKRNEFAYGPVTSRNGNKISIALLKEADECIISSSYISFKIVKPDELNADYLMLLFSNPEFDRYARFNSWGSAREVFSWDDFCDSKLYIPDISEQKKIVKQFKALKDRIQLLTQINNYLYDYCKNGYKQLLKGLSVSDELPDGYSLSTIGNYADVKSGYAFKSNWWKKHGVPVIKIANISQNTVLIDGSDCVSDDIANKANEFSLQPGDLLIAMTGATTGKVGIVPFTNQPLLVNQRVGKFLLGDNPLDKLPFLFCSLLSDEVSNQTHPDGDAGSAQDNLSPDDIKNIRIVIPPTDMLNTFNDKYRKYIWLSMLNNAEIQILSSLCEHLVSNI